MKANTKKEKEEIIANLLKIDPCTIEEVLHWDPDQLSCAAKYRQEIALALAQRYVSFLEEVSKYKQAAEILLQGIRQGFEVDDVIRIQSEPPIDLRINTLTFVIPVPSFDRMNSGGNLALNMGWIPASAGMTLCKSDLRRSI